MCAALLFLLAVSAHARECESDLRKATENGPVDEGELRFLMKCEEKNATEGAGGHVCVIGGMPKRESRRDYGAVPITAIYSENPRYSPMVGLWHPHVGRSRNERNEIVDVAVTANNFGIQVTKRVRSARERFQLSVIEESLRYEKTRSTGARPPEHMEFSCVQVPLVDTPPVEEEPKRRRQGGQVRTSIATPGQSKGGTGQSGAKSGISGRTY